MNDSKEPSMNDRDIDQFLEQNLRRDPPSRQFRARVLQDSTTAFLHARRSYARWRLAALSAAAVFIAAVSFLLGRYSVPANLPPVAGPVAVGEAGRPTAVSSDLIAWLDAAQLFKRLGMEDRMARAVERAHDLLPANTADVPGSGFTARSGTDGGRKGPEESVRRRDSHESSTLLDQIMALSVGD